MTSPFFQGKQDGRSLKPEMCACECGVAEIVSTTHFTLKSGTLGQKRRGANKQIFLFKKINISNNNAVVKPQLFKSLKAKGAKAQPLLKSSQHIQIGERTRQIGNVLRGFPVLSLMSNNHNFRFNSKFCCCWQPELE